MDIPNLKLIYIVNARIPNERAHGIQISQTVTALSKVVSELVLVTPSFIGAPKVSDTLGFRHIRLLSLDVPFLARFRFYIRLISFIVFLQGYLFFEYFKSLYTRKKVVLYVRGEVIFGIIPFFKLFDVCYETHQIREHHQWYAWVIKRVTGVVVVTQRLKEKFLAEFKIDASRIIVARDAVDTDKFSFVPEHMWSLSTDDLKIPVNKKIVLYSGSLGHEKGVGTLAEAAQYLPDDVQVVFVGGNQWEIGFFRKQYLAVTNISILGQVPHDLVPQYLYCADVLVLPDLASDEYSNLYTSPMKLFEYMASGRAIVASDVPSLREVLNDTIAYFFTSGDARGLAHSITRALQNHEQSEKIGSLAQKEVAKYTWNKRAEQIISLIQTFS